MKLSTKSTHCVRPRGAPSTDVVGNANPPPRQAWQKREQRARRSGHVVRRAPPPRARVPASMARLGPRRYRCPGAQTERAVYPGYPPPAPAESHLLSCLLDASFSKPRLETLPQRLNTQGSPPYKMAAGPGEATIETPALRRESASLFGTSAPSERLAGGAFRRRREQGAPPRALLGAQRAVSMVPGRPSRVTWPAGAAAEAGGGERGGRPVGELDTRRPRGCHGTAGPGSRMRHTSRGAGRGAATPTLGEKGLGTQGEGVGEECVARRWE